MKVLLCGINSKYIHSNLAIRYLKAYTEDLNYSCSIKEYNINQRLEIILEDIITEVPDVIAFSAYIWNLDYIEKLSNLIKLVNKDIIIVYGGPEVSYDGKESLKSMAGDFLIEGEGEETFREFIECILDKESTNEKFKRVRGLYSKINNEIFFGGKRELMDFNKVVFPYKEDDDLTNKIVYFESSRGCPFMCKYCLSSTTQGVRFLQLDRVKKELDFFINKGVRLVKFVDRTFNCNHEFAMGVWKYLIERGGETTFHFEVSADLFKDDEIDLLKTAPKGKFQFEVGVQTTNNETLKNINRFVKFEVIKEKVQRLISGNNIHQHLDLIVGLPGENYSSFKKSFNDVYSIKPEMIQIGFLKLLKGSLMRDEMDKWGIESSPYAPYEILKSRDISYEEILKLKRVDFAVDKYHNSGKFNTIIKYFEKQYKEPFDFYYDLGAFFKEKGYFDRNLSSAEFYKVFLDFNIEVLKNSNDILVEIIKFDYLCFNKKRYLPPFLNRYSYDKSKFQNHKEHIEVFKLDILNHINNNSINEGIFYYSFKEDIPTFPIEVFIAD
ncbi:MAG: B12-binding domain-containing radical SAM protein [Clostridiaceae bacterium]